MDPDTESLLVSTCLALGGYEDVSEDMDDERQVYIMGDECLECLKDIKKFIKYYDEPGDNVVLSFLGKMGILEKDLIPIMMLNSPADNPTRERIVLACVELMVPMTWPIDYKELQELVIREEDNTFVGNLHQRLEIMREYKRAFLQPGVLGSVFAVMLRPLEVEHRMRTTRDQAVIRLGLSLFRNLVAIPDAESSIRGTMAQFISSIMQEELLERFQQENIMALFITLASCATDMQLAEWNTITLETFYHIFAGIDAEELIPTISGRMKNSQLQDLLKKEEKEKKSQSTAGRKRHDRFGTTGEVRLQDGTRMVLHQKGALFSSFETQLDTVKKAKAKAKRYKDPNEPKKNLSRSGSSMLKNLALTFLESGFNPLFTSLRRDIEAGREKFKDHHRAQYHYLMGFMLNVQRLYSDYLTRQFQAEKKDASNRQLVALEAEYKKNFEQYDLGLIAAVIEVSCVFQIIIFIRGQLDVKIKDRKNDDITAAMNCLQELFMTLYAMSKSPVEDYRDASDIVQNNLYYEDATLELFLDLTKTYTRQSTKYLNALVKMIHVLLKTLEAYSNSTSHIYIRKTRAKVKSRKDAKEAEEVAKNGEQAIPGDGSLVEPDEQADQEDGDTNGEERGNPTADDQSRISRDHKFVFSEFERRFANENVVNTYCAFLENFMNLDETQLHWAASLFHRIAVNCRNNAVFYKASTLHLFHQILQSNKEDAKRDMMPFISYLLHQFFKKMQEYPQLIVDVFFQRTSKSCLEINVGREEAERGQRIVEEKKEKKMMAMELQVDPNRPESEQIKIAVMALIAEDEQDLVEWTVHILKEAVAKRHLMAFRSESELAENPDLMYSVENVEDIGIVPDNPARLQSLKMIPRFRLLLKLLKFVKEDVGDSIAYKIPKDLPTDTISEYHDMIDAVLKEADTLVHYDYSALISTLSKPRKSNSTQNRRPGGERQVAKVKDVPVYHSAEYIVDSEDEDEAYFAAEAKLRDKVRVDFTEAEERQRKMAEKNAKDKRQKQMALLMSKKKVDQKNGDNEGSSGTAAAVVSLTDSEDESEDKKTNRAPPHEGSQSPPRRSKSDVESDDDEGEDFEDSDDDDLLEESDSEAELYDALEKSGDLRKSPWNQRRPDWMEDEDSDGTSEYEKWVLANGGSGGSDDEEDEDEDEDEGDSHATLPLSSTQPLSLTQTPTAQVGGKRRIFLEDSDDDGDNAGDVGKGDSPHNSQEMDDRPARKKAALKDYTDDE
ncbi:Topoisomerase 1-associated factor 1 [Dissophora globulifera]|nr:Topoisomerase 1-associated factor 1 [Dissophora globulifera]